MMEDMRDDDLEASARIELIHDIEAGGYEYDDQLDEEAAELWAMPGFAEVQVESDLALAIMEYELGDDLLLDLPDEGEPFDAVELEEPFAPALLAPGSARQAA